MRIIFLGDRIWGTSGYSKVIYNTAMRLIKEGHEIAHIPMSSSMKGGNMNYQGVLVYSSGLNMFGEDIAEKYYHLFKADMIVTVKDPWVFQEFFKHSVNWVPMAIIDHSPVSPLILSRISYAYNVIAISQFSQRQLSENKVESFYIPHGVDTQIYRPLNKKTECRKLFFLEPDEFVVGVVAMNRSRKMIPHMIRGYKAFLDMNPGIKSHMMLWSSVYPSSEEVFGLQDVGVNLIPEINYLGLAEAIRWPNKEQIAEGIPEWLGENYESGWDMVKLYNTFDVLLMCTGGEGFGLPIIEAQSCGIPVIVTDYTTGPEIVGSGMTCKSSDYVILNTPGTRLAIPDIHDMAECLTRIYNSDRQKLNFKARRFAEKYDWNLTIKNHWKPFLEKCETDLRPKLVNGELKSW
jgi:glycosyltransferase involved in cell wall biosynthesis